jgi:hypothetical protein
MVDFKQTVMNAPSPFLMTFPTGVLLLLMQLPCSAAEIVEITNRAGIKLSYIREATLNAAELQQVLSLAKQAGITNFGEVIISRGFPARSKEITVKSKERLDGRNIFYETIHVGKTGWTGFIKPAGARQSGNFWIDASRKYTTVERTYDLGGTMCRIRLSEGVDVAFADEVIPLIAVKKVRLKDDFTRIQFDGVDVLKPGNLRRNDSHHGSELWFYDSQDIILFDYEKGEVVITGVGHYVICPPAP